MGNRERLPIEAFRDEIMACESPYIIIEAETGSGKSTMVPQWYRELGFQVLVTEPLIETVRGTSEYVAELMGVEFGTTVGFRTAEARCDSPSTEILFCTDGLALVRELAGANRFGVLVIDELHEWNTNQSTLEAWAWKHLQEGTSPFSKIVVLSATLNSAELSRKRGNAPVFKVPGRQYPIEDRSKGASLVEDVRKLVGEGFDVLVFQPGEREILATVAGLSGLDAELIPFYGKLERADKNRAYRSYPRPKVVVSTNALETGRTLVPSPGRRLAVVDSGLEKREELVDGIEGLYLKPIARARGKQRRGRTGRIGDGVYIDHCPTTDRPDYPVPQILRTRLDQTVLRLAVVGYDATELPFFHDVSRETIVDAKRALRALGALAEDGQVTRTGRLMSRMPISVQYARMVVEARELGVVDDVVTIAALLEAGSLRDRNNPAWRDLTRETRSDLLAELDLWQAAQDMRGEDMKIVGIVPGAFFRAKEKRRNLQRALERIGIRFGQSCEDRDLILGACVAGMVDHLFKSEGYGSYRNGGNGTREKARESVVSGNPEWIVGLPKDISGIGKRGRPFILHLVTMVSAVDPGVLAEVAPQLVRLEWGLNPAFSAQEDSVYSTTRTFFNGQQIKEEQVADLEHEQAAAVFARWLSIQSQLPPVNRGQEVLVGDLIPSNSDWPATVAGQALDAILHSNDERQKRARQLNTRCGEEVFRVYSPDELFNVCLSACQGARRMVEVTNVEALRLPPLDKELETLVLAENPEQIELLGVSLPVVYRSGSTPSVKLEGALVTANRWQELPDEGVRLPGGRAVAVSVAVSYWDSVTESDIPRLKQRMREHRNAEQWNAWQRPELPTPNPDDPEAVFPEITECQYGTCVVTGEPLMAFGTFRAHQGYSYYGSAPTTWEASWDRNREEAEKVRTESAAKFAELQQKAQEKRELEAANAAAEAARTRLKGYYSFDDASSSGWYDLDSDLRQRFESRRYATIPSVLAECRQWTVETEALCVEVETGLAEARRQKEEAERLRLEEEARREAERQKAEEKERTENAFFAERFPEMSTYDLRYARPFAEACMAAAGSASRALRVLAEEYNAPYGRARRQEALRMKLVGLEETDAGSYILSLSQAYRLDPLIGAAIAWLETISEPAAEERQVPDRRAVKFRSKGRIAEPDEHVDTGSTSYREESTGGFNALADALRRAQEKKDRW